MWLKKRRNGCRSYCDFRMLSIYDGPVNVLLTCPALGRVVAQGEGRLSRQAVPGWAGRHMRDDAGRGCGRVAYGSTTAVQLYVPGWRGVRALGMPWAEEQIRPRPCILRT